MLFRSESDDGELVEGDEDKDEDAGASGNKYLDEDFDADEEE